MNKINFIIALASGGTGGHISPATAIYDDLKKKNDKIKLTVYISFFWPSIVRSRTFLALGILGTYVSLSNVADISSLLRVRYKSVFPRVNGFMYEIS